MRKFAAQLQARAQVWTLDFSPIWSSIDNESFIFYRTKRLVYADNNALVLEDLNRFDFKLANRKERFDLARTKVVLEKLAKYHAATAALHVKSPKLMELHQNSIMDVEEMTPISFFYMVSMQETIETIKHVPELVQFFERLGNVDIIEREKKVYSRGDEEKFHVLNHGDLWINNIFFSYNGQGEPVDALLVISP